MGCHHKRWSRYCSLISYPNSGPIYHSNGGLYTNNNAIKPSYTSEEVEKTTAKEIKRCLFSHGHHQTVSMNSIDSFKYDNFSGQDNATRTSPDQAIKRPIICIYGLLLLHLLHLLLLLHLCINALHL